MLDTIAFKPSDHYPPNKQTQIEAPWSRWSKENLKNVGDLLLCLFLCAKNRAVKTFPNCQLVY